MAIDYADAYRRFLICREYFGGSDKVLAGKLGIAAATLRQWKKRGRISEKGIAQAAQFFRIDPGLFKQDKSTFNDELLHDALRRAHGRIAAKTETDGGLFRLDESLSYIVQWLTSTERCRILAVTGEGGIGKTTLLGEAERTLKAMATSGWVCTFPDAAWINSVDQIYLAVAAVVLPDAYEPLVLLSRRVDINDADTADPGNRNILPKQVYHNRIIRALQVFYSNGRFGLLMFDHAERAGRRFRDALKEFLASIGAVDVAVIIAGRKVELDYPYGTKTMVLEEWEKDDAVKLLEHKGITDRELQTAIFERMGGNPYFLSVAGETVMMVKGIDAKTFNRQGSELTREQFLSRILIPRYVRYVALELGFDQELTDADAEELVLWIAELAVPRWLTPELADALGHNQLFEIFWASVDWGSKVKLEEEVVWVFHDRLREILLEEISHVASKRKADVHRICSIWFDEQSREENASVISLLERLYHLFRYDAEKGQASFEVLYRQGSDNYDINFCRMLLANVPENINENLDIWLWILLREGDFFRLNRQYPMAEKVYQYALSKFQDNKLRDAELLCSLLNNFGVVLVYSVNDMERLQTSSRAFEDCLKVAEEVDLPWYKSLALCGLGIAKAHIATFHMSRDDEGYRALVDEAIAYYQRSQDVCIREVEKINAKNSPPGEADIFWTRRYRLTEAKTHQNIGAINAEIGNNDAALEHLRKSVEIYQEISHLYYWCETIQLMLNIDPTLSTEYEDFDSVAATIYQRIGDTNKEALHAFKIGKAEIETGELARGIELLTHALVCSLHGYHESGYHHQILISCLLEIRREYLDTKAFRILDGLTEKLTRDGIFETIPDLARVLSASRAFLRSRKAPKKADDGEAFLRHCFETTRT